MRGKRPAPLCLLKKCLELGVESLKAEALLRCSIRVAAVCALFCSNRAAVLILKTSQQGIFDPYLRRGTMSMPASCAATMLEGSSSVR